MAQEPNLSVQAVSLDLCRLRPPVQSPLEALDLLFPKWCSPDGAPQMVLPGLCSLADVLWPDVLSQPMIPQPVHQPKYLLQSQFVGRCLSREDLGVGRQLYALGYHFRTRTLRRFYMEFGTAIALQESRQRR